jgi:protoheme ferro-lyase
MSVIRTATKRAPTAVAMMNMGGPSTLGEVESFLTNLFTDPEIIPMGPVQNVVGPYVAKRRTPKITDQYAQIGGGSPILKWSNIQGEEMCKLLDEIRPEVRLITFAYCYCLQGKGSDELGICRPRPTSTTCSSATRIR